MNAKQFVPLSLAVGTMLLLSACGGAAKALPGVAPASASARPAASAAAPQTRAVGAPAGAAQAPAGPPNQTAAQAQLPPIPPLTPMVVKNANLSISVDDTESSLNQVDVLVKTEQGTITSQTVRTQNDKTYANLTIQVPKDNFEEILAKLRDLRAHGSRVLSDTVSAQDVTEQFVDLDAQYRNLQSTRDAYQKLLDKATAVSDIVTLTREVATIQTQMDQIKGRQNVLSRQSAMSTITLSLSPVGAPSPNPKPLPKPMQAAQDAWQALMAGLQGLAVVLIWMAILLPVPALALGIGWLVYRRVTRPSAA